MWFGIASMGFLMWWNFDPSQTWALIMSGVCFLLCMLKSL